MNKNYIKKYFSVTDLTEISNHITEIEKYTSGEIRICFRNKKSILQKKYNSRDLAIKEFHKLRMHKTIDKTGVLLFILFDEKKFEIVADEGINTHIDKSTWSVITNYLSEEFKNGHYKKGILKALDEIKIILHSKFPVKINDTNELSNDIVIK